MDKRHDEPNPFAAWWRSTFADVPPLGYELRAAFDERWLRVHSLPRSKRYADDDSERRILLKRQDTVACEVLGKRNDCFIVVPRFELLQLGEDVDVSEFSGLEFTCQLTGSNDVTDIYYLVATACWDAALMKSALLMIAKDEGRALWANVETGEVFAPYDGGVDLVVSSPGRRCFLEGQFSDWLSSRANGL